MIQDHVLWTTRLADKRTVLNGQEVDLRPYLHEHRDEFVIKPANEGRGYGVTIGKYASAEQWNQACQIDPHVPKVVQQFAPSIVFPVICDTAGQASAREMFLTLGLASICGRYEGLISRISANPVTNVAREGFGQAVFVDANGD